MSPQHKRAVMKNVKKAQHYAWSPAARAKRKATYAAKRARRSQDEKDMDAVDVQIGNRAVKVTKVKKLGKSPTMDAIIYLTMAVSHMGPARTLSRSDTLTLLALQTLKGE